MEFWVTWSNGTFLYKAIHTSHQLKIKFFYLRCKREMGFFVWENVLNSTLCCDEGCVNGSFFFFPEENYLVEQTRFAWDCKPSYKLRPFPSGSWTFSFCCSKSSSVCLAYTSRTESRGSASKATLQTRYQWAKGTPKTFPLQEWGVSPLHFPFLTDACVCKLFLSHSITFTSYASNLRSILLVRRGRVKGRWVNCLWFGVFQCER